MNHDFTLRAVNVVLEMFDNTTLAEGVETLGDSGGIHQVARTDLAGDHLIDAADVDFSLTS